MINQRFLTTEEAARLLNVHTNTIVRWIKQGKLPSSKIGREHRIPREAIENRVRSISAGTRILAVTNQKGGVRVLVVTQKSCASLYDFTGKVLQSKTTHTAGTNTNTILETMQTTVKANEESAKQGQIQTQKAASAKENINTVQSLAETAQENTEQVYTSSHHLKQVAEQPKQKAQLFKI